MPNAVAGWATKEQAYFQSYCWISNYVVPEDEYGTARADAARVQRVHLHPLKIGNECIPPVLKQPKFPVYS